jgi:hypothetical protein
LLVGWRLGEVREEIEADDGGADEFGSIEAVADAEQVGWIGRGQEREIVPRIRDIETLPLTSNRGGHAKPTRGSLRGNRPPGK